MSDRRNGKRIVHLAPKSMFGLALVVLLGTAGVRHGLSQTGAGSNTKASAAAASSKPTTGPTAQQLNRQMPRGQQEGIKVHGHWVIEVRKPNGELSSHTEFENSLQNGGQAFLAAVLSGNQTPGGWQVILDLNSTQKPCTNALLTNGLAGCALVEAGSIFASSCASNPGLQCFTTLTVSPPSQSNTFTLSGTATAGANGVIDSVLSNFQTCTPSTATSACPATLSAIASSGSFSAATLPQTSTSATPCGGSGQISCAVPVNAGQTINVSVTYSFQ